jgi:hypothetical protein
LIRRSLVRIAVLVFALLALRISVAQTIAQQSGGNTSPLPASPPTNASTPPSPIPFALGAPPVLSPARNVIVLLGAGDAATAGRLIATFANRLRHYRLVNNAFVVPEPTWTVNDFITSCKTDPTVAGALVTTLVAATASQKDWAIYRDFHFQLAGAVMWIACAAPKPKITSKKGADSQADATYIVSCVQAAVHNLPLATIPQATLKPCVLTTPKPPPDLGAPEIAWVSPVFYAADKPVREWAILQMLTSALAVVSVYETFRPSVVTTSGSTTSFPITVPIPHTGELSSVSTNNMTTTNPSSGLASLATALYAQGITYTNTVGALPITDDQSYRAASDVIDRIAGAMNCRLKVDESPEPRPSATPVDSFPAYRFGSASYPRHTEGESAPFCDQR